MFFVTDDVRIDQIRPLIPPAILMEELPLSDLASETVSHGRNAASQILAGQDDRLMAVVGPCSIHDEKACLAYAGQLKALADDLKDDVFVVMRVYFEKPRTTVGWKGLINDPDLDGSFVINKGLKKARGILLQLAELGIPAGTEFLDTISPQFIADLVTWGAIGARTTESQIHRELASGLSMPVGFKNGTDGNIKIAIDAIGAAYHPHRFLSVTKQGIAAIVSTRGNKDCHVILRGGSTGPNYSAEAIDETLRLLGEGGPQRVMVDCSHGNSQKDHNKQPLVAESIAEQIESGSQKLFGVMLESNLVEGKQSQKPGQPLTYGQSITDACLGWESTVSTLEGLAKAVRKRRAK